MEQITSKLMGQTDETTTSNPHGDSYWSAYQDAKSMSDDELIAARRRTGQMIAEANVALRRAQGADAGYADAQRERRGDSRVAR